VVGILFGVVLEVFEAQNVPADLTHVHVGVVGGLAGTALDFFFRQSLAVADGTLVEVGELEAVQMEVVAAEHGHHRFVD